MRLIDSQTTTHICSTIYSVANSRLQIDIVSRHLYHQYARSIEVLRIYSIARIHGYSSTSVINGLILAFRYYPKMITNGPLNTVRFQTNDTTNIKRKRCQRGDNITSSRNIAGHGQVQCRHLININRPLNRPSSIAELISHAGSSNFPLNFRILKSTIRCIDLNMKLALIRDCLTICKGGLVGSFSASFICRIFKYERHPIIIVDFKTELSV